MDTELGLNVGDRYNIALLVSKNAYQVFLSREILRADMNTQLFFPVYIVLEIPSNMVLKHVRPSLFLPGLVFCWGKPSALRQG